MSFHFNFAKYPGQGGIRNIFRFRFVINGKKDDRFFPRNHKSNHPGTATFSLPLAFDGQPDFVTITADGYAYFRCFR